MKNQHTPGPWEFETKGSKHFVDGADGLTVCVLDRQGVRDNRDENEANARLISAAPELLQIAKAYRNLLKTMARSEGEIATFEHIEAVILSAEGEQ